MDEKLITDLLFKRVARFLVDMGTISQASIMRKFMIGHRRSGSLMDDLEKVKIIRFTDPAGTKPELIVKDLYQLRSILAKIDCDTPGVCRFCGCTEDNACIHPDCGFPCSWVCTFGDEAETVCSLCEAEGIGLEISLTIRAIPIETRLSVELVLRITDVECWSLFNYLVAVTYEISELQKGESIFYQYRDLAETIYKSLGSKHPIGIFLRSTYEVPVDRETIYVDPNASHEEIMEIITNKNPKP